ncbi:PUA-like domain protein [Cordyceps fumosorosea ARSEF 2679]|uniref:PUA-like domain protein n=1 Tax=Cordyceps fumosorosea (strain ARSEF 2679) TaxID=1081104 RepID=A0A168DEJ5_CORFA|nr:PUA-like domain protein [Cordyceps fumosorosea ARSEF 2679]OAA72511.1 PUA-like domain protein [Cordyceps fumosorosea ARSEF 2679]
MDGPVGMEVHLLVYDLSRGLAKDISLSVLGFQLDAIYHTSIELRGREFVYDGGILEIVPGSSHLGRPQQRLRLGTTLLPMDVIREFLTSIKSIYTAEAYDLFNHNCNNFTDSFSNFLLGKGIPEHITSMPQAVLDSPMGRMMLPRLTQGMNARRNGLLGLGETAASAAEPKRLNQVHNAIRIEDYHQLLAQSSKAASVVFFTSPTCPPCKAFYPFYDQVAEHYGRCIAFIKVDISLAHEIAAKHEVTATPTFLAFFRGEQLKRWTGADRHALESTARLLVQMGTRLHAHDGLQLPNLSPHAQPVLYPKTPPLSKLHVKMGAFSLKPDIQAVTSFLELREKKQPAVLGTSGLLTLGQCVRGALDQLAPDIVFTAVDLFRTALADPDVSVYYAEERDVQTIDAIAAYVNKYGTKCPYSMRLVTLHAVCNMFSTPVFAGIVLGNAAFRQRAVSLISSSLLDGGHANARVAASSLLFNLTLANRQRRREGDAPSERLSVEEEVELAASLVEAVTQENESAEALHGMLLSLGHLVFGIDQEGELADLLRALDAKDMVLSKKKIFPHEKLVKEVGEELLGKGLHRP